MTRPRVLFIAPASPAPDGNGLAMRGHLFLEAYAQAADVDLAVIPVAGGAAIDPRAAALCRRSEVIALSGQDTHFSLVQALSDPQGRLSAFERYGKPAVTAFLTREVRDALAAFAEGPYDLVHVFRTYLADLAWGLGGRIFVDCDEMDSDVLAAIAGLEQAAGRGEAAQWTRIDARHYLEQERALLPRADLCFAASAGEARKLARLRADGAVTPIANPAPPERAAPKRIARRNPLILLVGTMNYAPNVAGAVWFAKQVLPRLRHLCGPRTRLVIAGRRPSAAVRRLAQQPGVRVAASVPDLRPFYRRADLVVAPLRAGGGTRIKLLEAVGMRRPIVSTRIGAEGLGLRHGRDLLLADDAPAFARACSLLIRHPDMARRFVANAARVLAVHEPRLLQRRILEAAGLERDR